MFANLISDQNKIQVCQPVHNRDEDEVGHFTLGNGYGVFRSLSDSEFGVYKDFKYQSVGIILYYVPDTEADSMVVDSKTVTKTRTVPQLGDYCTWRGNTYHLSGVAAKLDIRGNFVGYKVLCSNV